jgi:hypothetical protein
VPNLGHRTLNWPFLAAGAVLVGLAGIEPAVAQELRLKAVDQASRNPEFSAFHKALLDAVRRRDTDYVVDRASPDIKLSFGDDYGQDTFREWLSGAEDELGEQYWRELQTVLEFGGVFMEDGAFCTPYLSCMDVPGCPECDPYETVFVTKANAVARSQPDEAGEVAAKLSWNVLQLDYDVEAAEGWYPVKLPDGQSGFVAYDDARMAIDYRARFEKTAEGWRMTVFIAGD